METLSLVGLVRLGGGEVWPILTSLEDEVAASRLFAPAVVYGYFPAQADGNDVIVYEAPDSKPRPCSERWEASAKELLRFTFPRQKEGRRLSIADFFAPKSSG